MDPVHCIVASSSPHEGWDVVWIYRLEMKKWLSCNNRQSNSMQNPESNKGNVNYNRHNQLKLKSKCNGYFDKMSAQERKRRCQIPTIGVISCTEWSQYTAAPVQGWMDQADAISALVTAGNTTRRIGQALPEKYKILFWKLCENKIVHFWVNSFVECTKNLTKYHKRSFKNSTRHSM